MIPDRITIKKDFLNLIKGDVITISTDSDRRVYFTVENRTQKVRFFGNSKGKWGKDNPYREGENEFFLIDEPIGYKTVIEFGCIPPPAPHPTKVFSLEDNILTIDDWISKILNDLKLINVI